MGGLLAVRIMKIDVKYVLITAAIVLLLLMLQNNLSIFGSKLYKTGYPDLVAISESELKTSPAVVTIPIKSYELNCAVYTEAFESKEELEKFVHDVTLGRYEAYISTYVVPNRDIYLERILKGREKFSIIEGLPAINTRVNVSCMNVKIVGDEVCCYITDKEFIEACKNAVVKAFGYDTVIRYRSLRGVISDIDMVEVCENSHKINFVRPYLVFEKKVEFEKPEVTTEGQVEEIKEERKNLYIIIIVLLSIIILVFVALIISRIMS